jgi:hypothetical protein
MTKLYSHVREVMNWAGNIRRNLKLGRAGRKLCRSRLGRSLEAARFGAGGKVETVWLHNFLIGSQPQFTAAFCFKDWR